jgi:hypothetical protein
MASAPPDRPAAAPLSRGLALLVLAAFGFGLWRAIQLAWICDDAFISLRYAENLVQGFGLVYNPGEYVEGYTNLLWTLALAGALALGLPDIASAQWLGIASYAATAALLLAESLRRRRAEGSSGLPLAALVVLVAPDFHEWASGGLETSLFTALALAGMLGSRHVARSGHGALGTGVLLALLTLTRPDGLLFAVAAAAGLAWDGRRREALRMLAPVILTACLWALWKGHYYGELLPTAFHSKSVLSPYYAQGLVYLGLFLAKSWYLPLAGGALVAWRVRSGDALSSAERDATVLAGTAGLFLAYVVHVGGDFMFARRILPAVPLLLLALETLLCSLPSLRLRAATTVACVVAAALPYPVYGDGPPRIRGVADERRFYTDAAIAKRRRQAEAVGVALAGAPARVMFEGGMCVFGYYSGLPYQVEMSGLTQYSLAKLPLERRGWIGHEKQATEAWLDEHDIHLIVSHRFPPISRPRGDAPVDLVFFGDVAVARIHRYEPAVMDVLARAPGVSFVPIEETLARKRREIERASPERAEQTLAWLERFYLDRAGQAGAREAASLRALVEQRRASVR